MKSAVLKMLILCLFPVLAMAARHTPGVGGVAQNMMQPVSLLSDFVHTACYVIGGSFLFASVVKYFEHKRSPLMVTLGTVVFLAVAGLALIALPLLSRL